MAGGDVARKSDLGVRVLSAVVMVAVAGTALWLGGWVWTALVAAIAVGVLWEWRQLVRGFASTPARRGLWNGFGFIYVAIAAGMLLFLRSEFFAPFTVAVGLAGGQRLLAFLRPILRFAWPILLAIAASGLLIWPWANGQIDQLRSEFAQRSDMDRIAPGEFQRNKAGNRVFFTESQSGQNQSGQVFIYGLKDGKTTITTAQGGRIVRTADGSAQLELSHGQSVSQDSKTGEQNISTFAQYSTRIQDAPAAALQTQTRSRPSHQLLHTADGRGELSWRIGMALAAINLLLLALLLIKSSQRSGKGSHLALALMSFAVYYNLINFGQNWVSKGQISLGWWLLILHGGMFIACYGLLLQRQGSLPFFQTRRAQKIALVS